MGNGGRTVWSVRLETWVRGLARTGDRLVAHVANLDVTPISHTVVVMTRSGEICWRTPHGAQGVSLVTDGVVVADGTEIIKLDIGRGEPMRRRSFGGTTEILAPSAVGPVVGLPGEDGLLLSQLDVLHPETLATLWSAADPNKTLVHDTFACRRLESGVEVTDLRNGEVRSVLVPLPRGWHVHADAGLRAFGNGECAAVDLIAGTILWRRTYEAKWLDQRSTARLGSRAFVHVEDGLSCFDLSTGDLVWRREAEEAGRRWLVGMEKALYLSEHVLWCVTSRGVYQFAPDSGALIDQHLFDDATAEGGVVLSDKQIVLRLSGSLRCLEFA